MALARSNSKAVQEIARERVRLGFGGRDPVLCMELPVIGRWHGPSYLAHVFHPVQHQKI